MAKKRKSPFGYMMQNGKIEVSVSSMYFARLKRLEYSDGNNPKPELDSFPAAATIRKSKFLTKHFLRKSLIGIPIYLITSFLYAVS